MAKVSVHKPNSFSEFVDVVDKLQNNSEHSLWYRGCGRDKYDLIPAIYRHPDKTIIQDIAQLEQEILVRFQQRSIPMLTRPLGDEWDTLFFMQHYRIPTRLLDWTENPFIGLYFAVMSANIEISTTGIEKSEYPAAVWILNPGLWNRHSLRSLGYDGNVLSQGDDALNGYKPREKFDGMIKTPVAIYGAHN